MQVSNWQAKKRMVLLSKGTYLDSAVIKSFFIKVGSTYVHGWVSSTSFGYPFHLLVLFQNDNCSWDNIFESSWTFHFHNISQSHNHFKILGYLKWEAAFVPISFQVIQNDKLTNNIDLSCQSISKYIELEVNLLD